MIARVAPFPWPILVAFAVLWFAPAINRWVDRTGRPRPEPPQMHQPPAQVRIIRPRRELERRDDW